MFNTVDSKKRSSKNLFFSGVLILTVASILVKAVGLISKIALNRVVGSVGAGYYSSAYEIYAFLYVISTSGLPVAISIMIAKSVANGNSGRANRIFNTAFKVFATMGLVLTGLMIIFSPQLSKLMGAPETESCIKAVAPTLFFICISSCIRGYFQGYQLMGPTAVSQIIEAVFKVVIGICGALYAKNMGYADHIVAAYTVMGVTVGVFLGTLYLTLRKYIFDKYNRIGDNGSLEISSMGLIKEMLKIAVPITLSSSVLSLTTILDTFMIQNRLLSYGMDKTTIRIYYGDYTSLVISMFNLPTILIYPIANALVPLISASVAKNDEDGGIKIRKLGMRMTAIISIPCAVGMAVFSAPILNLLMFKDDSVERAAPWLSVAAISVIFLGVIAITNAFLNSAGHQRLPIISMLCGATVKLAANLILLDKIGMIGAPIATVLCYLTASVMNIYFVIKKVGDIPNPFDVFFMPFVCAAICVSSSLIAYTMLTKLISVELATFAAILIAALVYAMTVIKSRTVSEEEIMLVPKGRALITALKKLKIIK